jgi:hypothetical protein
MSVYRTRIAVVTAVALGALIVGPSAVALEVPPLDGIVSGLLGNDDEDPNADGELPADGGKFQSADPNSDADGDGCPDAFECGVGNGAQREGKQIKGVDRKSSKGSLPGTGA